MHFSKRLLLLTITLPTIGYGNKTGTAQQILVMALIASSMVDAIKIGEAAEINALRKGFTINTDDSYINRFYIRDLNALASGCPAILDTTMAHYVDHLERDDRGIVKNTYYQQKQEYNYDNPYQLPVNRRYFDPLNTFESTLEDFENAEKIFTSSEQHEHESCKTLKKFIGQQKELIARQKTLRKQSNQKTKY